MQSITLALVSVGGRGALGFEFCIVGLILVVCLLE